METATIRSHPPVWWLRPGLPWREQGKRSSELVAGSWLWAPLFLQAAFSPAQGLVSALRGFAAQQIQLPQNLALEMTGLTARGDLRHAWVAGGREKMSPHCSLLPIPLCSWHKPISTGFSGDALPAGLFPSTGNRQLQRLHLGWGRGLVCEEKNQSVLALIQCHLFLTSYFTNKTKAALKWMPGLAGCQRQQETKAGNTNAAGSGSQGCLCGRESALPWRHSGQTGQERTRTGMDWEPLEPQEPRQSGGSSTDPPGRTRHRLFIMPVPGTWAVPLGEDGEGGYLQRTCFKQKGGNLRGFVWLPSTRLAPWDAPSRSSSVFPGPRHQAGTGQLVYE